MNGYVNCGQCGMINANLYLGPSCNFNGLSRRAIESVIASANGEQVLILTCGGGFRPLVEKPVTVAQKHWELPRALPILR